MLLLSRCVLLQNFTQLIAAFWSLKLSEGVKFCLFWLKFFGGKRLQNFETKIQRRYTSDYAAKFSWFRPLKMHDLDWPWLIFKPTFLSVSVMSQDSRPAFSGAHGRCCRVRLACDCVQEKSGKCERQIEHIHRCINANAVLCRYAATGSTNTQW